MDEDELKVGAFYWVTPVLDVDTDEAWEHGMQPARFAGKREDGVLLWHCLNVDGLSDWPMRFIGTEITET